MDYLKKWTRKEKFIFNKSGQILQPWIIQGMKNAGSNRVKRIIIL